MNGSTDATVPPIVIPTNGRQRLESTASSLFFPGGWFSKAPEGRASLEHAGGEFIPTSPKSSSMETEGFPALSVPAPAADSATTPVEETQSPTTSESGKKDRWGCVMM